MKLIYKGKFDGNVESIPHGEHQPGAVKFKEPEDPKKLAVIANGISIGILVLTIALLFWRGGVQGYNIWGVLLSMVTLIPHEFLHAICFKEEVYLYSWLSKGMMFVTGLEVMTKGRYVFMSLLPNLVFGFIPFIMFLINPSWSLLGSMGAFAISMGAGDYLNVYNALTQMPKGAKTYLYGFNSWWYIPNLLGNY